MNVWNLRPAQKADLKLGEWKSGKITRSAFPLSRSGSKSYRLGTGWHWRQITFSAGGNEYRVLAAYRAETQQFQAMLGMDVSGDTKVIASLEYHPDHGGWHMHYARDPLKTFSAGIKRGPWVKRHVCTDHTEFGEASEKDWESRALTIVVDVYGLHKDGSKGLLL